MKQYDQTTISHPNAKIARLQLSKIAIKFLW